MQTTKGAALLPAWCELGASDTAAVPTLPTLIVNNSDSEVMPMLARGS
jgi:hypothetical protein